MAPKKTLLLITAILLTTGLAASNSFEEAPQNQVWLNGDSEVSFIVDYSSDCKEGSEQTSILDSNSDPIETFDTSRDQVEDENGDKIGYNYSYGFGQTGAYTVEASCDAADGVDSSNEPQDVTKTVNVGELEIDLQGLPDADEETVYEGNTLDGSIDVNTNSDQINSPDLDFDYRFNEESSQDLEVNDGGFSGVEASDSDFDTFTVSASNNELGFEVEDSHELNVEDVWQVEGLSVSAGGEVDDDDYTVKYRNLGELQASFTVAEEGEGVSGFGSGDFVLDSEGYSMEEDWFAVEDNGGGEYSLSIDGRPVYEDLDVTGQRSMEVILSDEEEVGRDLEVVDVTVEKDVEFSGRVLDVSNNRVDTAFEAVFDGRVHTFETDDSGSFEKYINTDKVDMKMKFPEATVSLKNMYVDKEEPGDISYNYYDNIGESSLNSENLPEDVRPVNLASFISNYNFDGESLDTFVDMQFDTDEIRPEDIEVYECNEWTFRAEECAGNWERIDDNDVTLEAGATWNAEFPIDPRESNRFSSDQGVLSNAYLVGVPKGVGEGLKLGSEPDYSSSRVKSGEEFSISGQIISDSTGEPVQDADVELDLIPENGEEFSDSDNTSEDGGFELSTEVEGAGSYDVVLSANKDPYEGLEVSREDDKLDVYYETGLVVSSESDPTVELGEPYSIEYTVENTGQASAEDLEFSVSGVDDDSYELGSRGIDSLDAGNSQTVDLSLTLDEDLTRPPTVTFEVSGSSTGEDIRGSATTTVNLDRSDQSSSDNSSDDSEEEETSTESSSSLPDTEDITRATGEFVESQSDMNLALGLILIFGVILAVAVRKRKEGGGRDDRMNGGRSGSRPVSSGSGRVQKPDVSPEKVEPQEDSVEEESSSSEEASEEEPGSETGSDESDGEFVCDTCGESFDTESGLNLHTQALH